MRIRDETPGDRDGVRAVNLAAFDTALEADLVDRLRGTARPLVSLVAESGGEVVGHILFSPAALGGHAQTRIMALGPMAVAPRHQRQGIGSALVRSGLQRCRALGADAVVVLGHPDYYPRFGFQPAARFDLRCTYDVPEEVFMALELAPAALDGKAGPVEYDGAFDAVPEQDVRP